MPSLTKVQSGFMEAQGALPLSPGTAAAPGLKFDDHAGTGMFSPSTGEIAFSTSNHSQAVTFKTDGKVGINETTPASQVDIKGNVSSTTQFSGFDGLRVHNANGSAYGVTADMYFTAGTVSSNRGAAIGVEFTSASSGNDLYFATNGGSVTSTNTLTERLRITSVGKIEVKGTRAGALQANDDDALKLYTKSTDNSINRGVGITFYTHDGSGYEMGGTIQVAKENGTIDDAKSYMRFSTQSGSTTEKLRITSTGNIGLNEPAPYYKLHMVFNNTTTSFSGGESGAWGGDGIRIENTNTTVGSMSLVHFRNYDADWHIGSKYVGTNSAHFVFNHESSERLRITGAGKIILPTGSPGIQFGSTDNPAASGGIDISSQTLDDYEEGTYSASITMGGSGTVTMNPSYDTLTYTKIGRMVYVTGQIRVSSVSNPVGGTLVNLPFTVRPYAWDARGGGTVALYITGQSHYYWPLVYQISESTSQINITHNATGYFLPAANNEYAISIMYIVT